MHVLQDTLDKMIRAFGERKKLKGARNYCEVTVLDHTTDAATGAPQPPGEAAAAAAAAASGGGGGGRAG